MEARFRSLADHVQASLQGSEAFTLSYHAEQSDFVRINHGKVRQPGFVDQASATVRLIAGKRQASCSLTLSGDPSEDGALVGAALASLREALPHLPDDPHLLVNESDAQTSVVGPDEVPPAATILSRFLDEVSGLDAVGILARGPVARGFASSWGQRAFTQRTSFNLDWSLVHSADRAVKQNLAGESFDPAALTAAVASGRDQLQLLARPARTLAPGQYRAWLAPAALQEIWDLLSWGGFSESARRTRQSPLQLLADGEEQLHESLSVSEDVASGVAPGFQSDGFVRPPVVPLITAGRSSGSLIAPRTAREYGLQTNGAGGAEHPVALTVAPGELDSGAVLQALGTGIWVSNLWYLNYSDRAKGRMTGMTRFACFWVEGGEIVAPINVMRFDDTAWDLLGRRLEALGSQVPLALDTSTYGQRAMGSTATPGALVSGISFTL